MSSIFDKSTLEYYNYGEQNNFQAAKGPAFSVKVSDKEGNIITIEKDDSLYAMVGLTLDSKTGIMKLIDKAHDDSVLAEIEMPDADYIYNCRFDKDRNLILFDVKSLYGDETSTIELDVDDLIELYDAGQGIEIGEKDAVTGRRPISIKLAEGENILKVSDSGLSISDTITTDDELEAAISGKADVSYVDELFNEISGFSGDITTIYESISGLTDNVEKIIDIIGTDVDDPNLSERIDSKADLDDLADLENEVGEIEVAVNKLSGDTDVLKEKVSDLESDVNEHSSNISEINESIERIDNVITDINSNIADIEGDIEDNKVKIVKVTSGLGENIKEAYVLENNLGEQLGEQINIYNDSTLESIEYDAETQSLVITYIKPDGERKVEYVDLSKMVIEAEFADGFVVEDGKVYIKIDSLSDDYLTVSENGLKLFGISSKIQEIENDNLSQWEALSSETAARISSDAALTSYVDTKVDAEKERAELAEASLNTSINDEISNRIADVNELNTKIDDEIQNRTEADEAIRFDLGREINDVSTRMSGFQESLSEEIEQRIAADDAINTEIGIIKNTYATKEYVDEKTSDVLSTAVESAVTIANEYSDLKNDELEIEIKQYVDNEDSELQNAISDNTTKINAISNLKGVVSGDTTNYDDSGNGILDVLHREFHQLEESIGYIVNETLEKTNLHEVAFGEYNKSNTGEERADQTIFSIGIGTSDEDRRNALEVRKNGDVYMLIEGEFMQINNLIGMLAHETYD